MVYCSTIIFVICATYLHSTTIASPIINGDDVAEIIVKPNNDFPFMVHLKISGKFPIQGKLEDAIVTCGGAIISNNAVLTAAHCLGDTKKEKPKGQILAGITDMKYEKSLAQERILQDFVIHPGYSQANSECTSVKSGGSFCSNDIALIFVNTPFEFSNRVNKAVLSTSAPPHNGLGWILGWGAVSPDRQQQTTMLQKTQLRIISKADCKKHTNLPINDQTICLLSDSKRTISCQGDSGGPFVLNGQVYGILSFAFSHILNGKLYCDATRPALYTKVADFGKWISDKIIEHNRNSITLSDLLYSSPSVSFSAGNKRPGSPADLSPSGSGKYPKTG